MAYDALWSLAFALNSTNQMMEEMTQQEILSITGCNLTGGVMSLEDFTYDNEPMGCVIRWNLQRTNFIGVSVGYWSVNSVSTKGART